MLRSHRSLVLVLGLLLGFACTSAPVDETVARLRSEFSDPPATARPDAFWTWLNGSVDRERMTAEMESMRKAGFSRLQVWDVRAHQDPEKVVPAGPAFLSDAWLENLAFADREARRLGLELGLVASSGWNAGGDWVKPEDALQGLYFSHQVLVGPVDFAGRLTFPEVPEHAPRGDDGRPLVWETVAVQAYEVKARDATFEPSRVIDLTDQLDGDHNLTWRVPEGRWGVRWIISANTGQRLIVPSPNSDGLQIDFFDAEDSRRYFHHVCDRLESALGPLAESALRYLEVDSLELEGSRLRAWTEDILEVFRTRYGYDARPWLAQLAPEQGEDDPGASGERGDRFLHDWTRLVSDLMIERHYRVGQAVLAERGLFLSAEAGGPGPPIWNSCPVDALGALGAVGLMRGEFWAKHRSMYHVKGIASAAHTYGHAVVDAESFTSWRHWRDTPYYLKLLLDQAFLDGLNHVTFHTSPHDASGTGRPGFAYHAGTHMGPTLCWWPMAGPFIDYVSRCSHLLQQGVSVADVLLYQGAGAPAFHRLGEDEDPSLRAAGFDYDLCDVRVLTRRLTARDGRLWLPHGASYEILVLPESESIDLEALRAIEGLVRAGATVVGPKPRRSSSLDDAERADEEVRRLAGRLWGQPKGEGPHENRLGAGRVIAGRSALEVLREIRGLDPDFAWEGGDRRTRLGAIHRRMGDTEIWFVVNQNERAEEVEALFRVTGRRPEIWDPATGASQPPRGYRQEGVARTRVPLRLEPAGSCFVVFRRDESAPPEVVWSSRAVARVDASDDEAGADIAHGDAPQGPMWLSSGERSPSDESIVLDLGSVEMIHGLLIGNYQDQARGLLTRGVKEVDVSVSRDGRRFGAPVRHVLARAPEIGERSFSSSIDIGEEGRFVRLDVVSNHSDDWTGRTRLVGLNRVEVAAKTNGVRVHAVSSGIAHDPAEADDRERRAPGVEIRGPWRIRFPTGRGVPGVRSGRVEIPEVRRLPKLVSWTDMDFPGARHFSGVAEYDAEFLATPEMWEAERLTLDLGRVAGVARVRLNGQDLGVVWKPPFTVDITGRLAALGNDLEIEVANTWHNRLVGDAGRPPEERVTTTNIRNPFRPDTPLLESGLLGPVRVILDGKRAR